MGLWLSQFQFSMAYLQRKPPSRCLSICTSRHTHQILCICVITCTYTCLDCSEEELIVSQILFHQSCGLSLHWEQVKVIVHLPASEWVINYRWGKIRLGLYSLFNVWLDFRIIGLERTLPGHPTVGSALSKSVERGLLRIGSEKNGLEWETVVESQSQALSGRHEADLLQKQQDCFHSSEVGCPRALEWARNRTYLIV